MHSAGLLGCRVLWTCLFSTTTATTATTTATTASSVDERCLLLFFRGYLEAMTFYCDVFCLQFAENILHYRNGRPLLVKIPTTGSN